MCIFSIDIIFLFNKQDPGNLKIELTIVCKSLGCSKLPAKVRLNYFTLYYVRSSSLVVDLSSLGSLNFTLLGMYFKGVLPFVEDLIVVHVG